MCGPALRPSAIKRPDYRQDALCIGEGMGVCARQCEPIKIALPPLMKLAPGTVETDLPLLEPRGDASVIVTKTIDGNTVETPLAKWDKNTPVQYNDRTYSVYEDELGYYFVSGDGDAYRFGI